MSKRTIIRIHNKENVWPIVETWARQNNFRPISVAGPERIYQKGFGVIVAPMMLKVRNENQETILEAWIRVNTFVRLTTLFIPPSEMGIESDDSIVSLIPRKLARDAVNKLLDQLGVERVS